MEAYVNLGIISIVLLGVLLTSVSVSAGTLLSGSYTRPQMSVEWTVTLEPDKVILTGMIRNTSQGEIRNVEMVARALYADRSELGRERFIFLPRQLQKGDHAPFGMFFRLSDSRRPSEIECVLYLEPDAALSGLEHEFFIFTPLVPGVE